MGLFDSLNKATGGGLNIGLSMIPGVGSYLGQESANQANAQQSSTQMAFQERMSNSAHQREMADLKAAGLNPILTGMGGSGASTPSGSQATMGNSLAGLGEVSSSAMAALKLKKDLEQADANIKLTETQEAKTDAEAEVAKNAALDSNQTMDARANTNFTRMGGGKYAPQGAIPDYYIKKIHAEKALNSAQKAEAEGAKMDAEVHKKFNTPDNILQRLNQVLGGASSASKLFRGK